MASLLKLSRFSPRVALQRLLSAPKSTAAAPLAQSEDGSHGTSPKPFSEIPGEKGWPLIGVVKLITALANGKVGKDSFFYQAHEKYGPIVRLKSPGNQWVVLVSTPEATEALFRAEGKYPSRLPLLEKTGCDIHKMNNWPSPLIFSYGKEWKRIRSAISKQVIPKRVGNLTAPLCDITDDLLNYLKETNNGKIEDITPIITKWTFQNTAYFVFGENMRIFISDDPTHNEFIEAALEFIKQIFQVRPVPLYKYFPRIAYKDFIQATTKMRDLGKRVMERKVIQLSEDIARGTVDETKAVGILEQWLIEGKLTPEESLTQACDLLSAGLDNTKNTAAFLLYELAKHPTLQDQLYQEIKAVLGDKVNPSWEDMQNIPLVRHCLKETLRIYPSIQINARTIQEDAVITGYHVPAGTTVMSVNAPISVSEDYFEEPDKFIPERWSKDKESIHPFSSLPFGFGQRGCYGRRLAELEIYILLTKLIPRFTLSTEKESITLFQSLALKPNETVPITFTERPV